MTLFYVHQITGNAGRCILEMHAENLDDAAAWIAQRDWLPPGTYYIISADGYAGQQLRK